MRKILVVWLLLIPTVAYANMVWPALYLETRLFTWWAISVGLVVEYLFVRHLFSLEPKRAVIADVSANAVSAIAGIASAIVPLFSGGGGAAAAPSIAAPVTAETLEEDTAAEQEERQRALRRRRNASVRGGLLTIEEEEPEVTKTLLGE